MTKVTIQQARRLGDKYDINFDVVTPAELCYGMNVELEHGRRNNLTNNNLETTFKIALAHIMEFPDYYRRLRKLEMAAEQYWSRRDKPAIFL